VYQFHDCRSRHLKKLNIIKNTSTGLILGSISNVKIYKKINQYHQFCVKNDKLSILIDTKKTNELDKIRMTILKALQMINTMFRTARLSISICNKKTNKETI
jgi:hypothetical protein